MKITVVTNEYDENGGGLAFSCRRLVEMLKSLRHDVFVLSSSVRLQEIIDGGGIIPNSVTNWQWRQNSNQIYSK